MKKYIRFFEIYTFSPPKEFPKIMYQNYEAKIKGTREW